MSLWWACGSSGKNEENTLTPQQVLDSIEVVTGVGKLLPSGGFITITSTTTGVVAQVMVNEGDTIRQGEPLLQLKDSDPAYEVAQVSAQLESLRAANASTREDLAREELLLTEYERLYHTSRDLVKKNAETPEQLAAHERQWKQQLRVIESLKLEERANRLSERELEVDLQHKREKLAELTLKAGDSGVLLEWSVRQGQRIEPQTELGTLGNPDSVHIEAEVDELFAHRVQVGQAVVLRYVGRPEVLGTGKVSYVSPALSEKSILYEIPGEGEDRRVRKIYIQPDSPNGWLINAKVECQIQLN